MHVSLRPVEWIVYVSIHKHIHIAGLKGIYNPALFGSIVASLFLSSLSLFGRFAFFYLTVSFFVLSELMWNWQEKSSTVVTSPLNWIEK